MARSGKWEGDRERESEREIEGALCASACLPAGAQFRVGDSQAEGEIKLRDYTSRDRFPSCVLSLISPIIALSFFPPLFIPHHSPTLLPVFVFLFVFYIYIYVCAFARNPFCVHRRLSSSIAMFLIGPDLHVFPVSHAQTHARRTTQSQNALPLHDVQRGGGFKTRNKQNISSSPTISG